MSIRLSRAAIAPVVLLAAADPAAGGVCGAGIGYRGAGFADTPVALPGRLRGDPVTPAARFSPQDES